MKKFLLGLIIGLLLATSTNIAGAADELVKVYINGRQLITDTEPVIVNNRVFVPLRALCESLNMSVQWDEAGKTVRISNNRSTDDIITAAKEATVKILIKTDTNDSFAGSGFNIDPDGLVITNAHVVHNANNITVNFLNGASYKASVKAIDTSKDIAVLALDSKTNDLPTITLGDYKSVGVGNNINVFGYPLGASIAVTSGTVGNLEVTDVENFTIPLMQINAAIIEGTSGGPVVDHSGKVIGIIIGYFQAENGTKEAHIMGAAIPVNEVKPLLY